MPFDGSGYEPPRLPDPSRRSPRERVMTVLIAAVVILLFVLPVSAATLVDIVRAMSGR